MDGSASGALTDVGLLGAGGQAREAREYLSSATSVRFAAVDEQYVGEPSEFHQVDIATQNPELLGLPVLAAVGAPGLRRLLIDRWSGDTYFSLVSHDAWVSPSARLGLGVQIAPQALVSAGVQVGDHASLNVGASVSHDSVLGRFACLAPGARLAGNVMAADGVFVGLGALVLGEVRLGEGSVIGAGAVVKEDTVPNGVYVGAPARLVRIREGWLDAL